MASALVTLLILSWFGLATVTTFGYLGAWGWMAPAQHVRIAIPAFLFGTMAHAMTMFYFIGTGKVIKEAVAEHGFDAAWADETKVFKQRTFGLATWTILFIMATSILGGAVDTGHMAPWIHGILGAATVLIALLATLREVGCISRNLVLMDRLEQALAKPEAAAGLRPEGIR